MPAENDQATESNERREHWPRDASFFSRLDRHMYLEEMREREDNKKFDEGEKRMARIEEDLRPLKAMYYAVLGCGGVGTFLLMTLLYIYQTDKNDSKQMQEAIYKIATTTEKLVVSHQELEKDYRRDIGRIEKEIETFHNRNGYQK